MFAAGVRAHYVASALAARMMVGTKEGFDREYFVLVSAEARGQRRVWCRKGCNRQADPRTRHMSSAITVSLWFLCIQDLFRTESVMQSAGFLDLSNSESPEYTGRAVVALATDPAVASRSGAILVSAALAGEYGFTGYRWETALPL